MIQPTQIHMQILNPSDTQSTFVNKSNYNFGRLLEIATGIVTITGAKGERGYAGPKGSDGDKGDLGYSIFIYPDTYTGGYSQFVIDNNIRINDIIFKVVDGGFATVENLNIEPITEYTFNTYIKQYIDSKGNLTPSFDYINDSKILCFDSIYNESKNDVNNTSANIFTTLFLNDFVYSTDINFAENNHLKSAKFNLLSIYRSSDSSIDFYKDSHAFYSDYDNADNGRKGHLLLGSNDNILNISSHFNNSLKIIHQTDFSECSEVIFSMSTDRNNRKYTNPIDNTGQLNNFQTSLKFVYNNGIITDDIYDYGNSYILFGNSDYMVNKFYIESSTYNNLINSIYLVGDIDTNSTEFTPTGNLKNNPSHSHFAIGKSTALSNSKDYVIETGSNIDYLRLSTFSGKGLYFDKSNDFSFNTASNIRFIDKRLNKTSPLYFTTGSSTDKVYIGNDSPSYTNNTACNWSGVTVTDYYTIRSGNDNKLKIWYDYGYWPSGGKPVNEGYIYFDTISSYGTLFNQTINVGTHLSKLRLTSNSINTSEGLSLNPASGTVFVDNSLILMGSNPSNTITISTNSITQDNTNTTVGLSINTTTSGAIFNNKITVGGELVISSPNGNDASITTSKNLNIYSTKIGGGEISLNASNATFNSFPIVTLYDFIDITDIATSPYFNFNDLKFYTMKGKGYSVMVLNGWITYTGVNLGIPQNFVSSNGTIEIKSNYKPKFNNVCNVCISNSINSFELMASDASWLRFRSPSGPINIDYNTIIYFNNFTWFF